jgi:ribonuclease HI
MWIKHELNNFPGSLCVNSKIEIHYDSDYAAKSVLGVFNGKKNRSLIERIQSQYSEVSGMIRAKTSSIAFVHVKGHSGNRWNDRADSLAKRSILV